MYQQYTDFAVEKALALLSIDSPCGFTDSAIQWLESEYHTLGFPTKKTNKGGLLVDIGGSNPDDAILFTAHVDTLGAMVAEIKPNGRLRVSPLGGMHPHNSEGENVKIYTRNNTVYDGTLQLCNASTHVNDDYEGVPRSFQTTEIVIDEDVSTIQETRALGIQVGDIVAFAPRPVVTPSGYIKSRFLDDKLSVGILLGLSKMLHDRKLSCTRKVYIHFSVYEEVGHGGAASVPTGVTEVVSVDMGCIGDGLTCTEKQVSICAKDSRGPFSYNLTNKLILAAQQELADYAIDVYPHYGTDSDIAVRAGFDVRHGLIGPGVYASHGYERSHIDAVTSAIKLLKGYLFPIGKSFD